DPIRRLVLGAIVEGREKDRALPPRVRAQRDHTRPAQVAAPFEPQASRPERCVVQPVTSNVPSYASDATRAVLVVGGIQPGEMSPCSDRPRHLTRPFEL